MARDLRTESQPPTFALTEGTRLKTVYLPGNGLIQVGGGNARVECQAITVQMEAGQMGLVPWARVRYTDGSVRLVNLGKVDDVEFLDRLPLMVDEDEETH